jgi:signal transduction histidine kinase
MKNTFAAALMKINPSHSLRARIALSFGASTLLLSFILSVVVGQTSANALENDVGLFLSDLAYQMTDKLDRGMFERYRDIQIAAALPEMRDPQIPLSQKRALLERLQSTYPNYAWIGLTDTNGIVLASTGQLLESVDVSERPWYINSQDGPFVGDVHEALLLASLLPNSDGRALRFVDVAVPVYDQNEDKIGILGAHLSWEWAEEVRASLLKPLQERNQANVFILSSNGTVLLGDRQVQDSAEILTFNSVQNAQAGQNGFQIETWPDGNTYLTGYARSQGYLDYPGLGWITLVRQPIDTAFAPSYAIRNQILGIGVSLGLVFTLIGWGIASRITKPLVQITSAANCLRESNQNCGLPVIRGEDEVAALSASLTALVNALTQEIGERKQAEGEVRALNAHLEQRVTERTAQLEMTNKQLESFSYSVSHDLRAPLRAIIGFSNIIVDDLRDQLTAETAGYMNKVRDNARRMNQLIADLLAFARMGQQPIQKQFCALDEIARNVLDDLLEGQAERPRQLEIESVPPCQGDPALLKQVMVNLLSNALKFTQGREVPHIHFGCLQTDDSPTYFVRDNGAGFDMRYAEKLFNVFQRLHRAEDFEGTGVGLAIVEQIIRRHGGRIWAEAEVDKGATFYFTLDSA